jgi:inorganic pyrophosphatase
MTFWNTLQQMVNESEIVIDRPLGSAHPRYNDYIYPFDYGFLDGTTFADGDAIDCWVGSLGGVEVAGMITVVDPVKKDSEIKILLGCTREDRQTILECHLRGSMNGILVEKT